MNRRVEPGQEIEIWVKDIKDNKLILTEFNPAEKQEEIENFKSKSEGTVKSMKVVSVRPFGVFFEVENDKIGVAVTCQKRGFCASCCTFPASSMNPDFS